MQGHLINLDAFYFWGCGEGDLINLLDYLEQHIISLMIIPLLLFSLYKLLYEDTDPCIDMCLLDRTRLS